MNSSNKHLSSNNSKTKNDINQITSETPSKSFNITNSPTVQLTSSNLANVPNKTAHGLLSSSVNQKQESPVQNGNIRSFSLENLKLPPGITITKVDGPVLALQRKSNQKLTESVKTPPPSNNISSIIAAPSASNHSRLNNFGQSVSGSNVIVVDTGRMKDDLENNKGNCYPILRMYALCFFYYIKLFLCEEKMK